MCRQESLVPPLMKSKVYRFRCLLPVAQRPFNCITFICEAVENRLSEEQTEEFYAIETYYDHDLSENWYGATWSHSPKENLGIGATLYGAYRGQMLD